MSRENVEVMHSVQDAFNRRDVEALGALLAPDAAIVPMRAPGEQLATEAPMQPQMAAVERGVGEPPRRVRGTREVGDRVIAFGRIRAAAVEAVLP